MEIKYSVIIPAYNAEKTLERCLNSLTVNHRDDVELILINDGSTDQTEKICLFFAEQNKNIHYFWKENGGVSSARNLGLNYAKGKYVLFVDSDDFVKKEYFDVLDKALQSEPDFLLLGRTVYDGINFVQYPIKTCSAKSCDVASDILSEALKRQLLNAPSSKAFKRQLIEKNKIKFDERLPIGEDKVFIVRYIVHSKSVECINYSVYVLSVENEESLSRKKRENLSDYILLEHQLLFQAVFESDLSDINKQKYLKALNYSYYRSAYTVIAELHKLGYSRENRLKDTRTICNRYNKLVKCKYVDVKCILIALPIRLRLCRVIDFGLNKRFGLK